MTPLPQNQIPKRVGKGLPPAYAVPLAFMNASSGGRAGETATPPRRPLRNVRRSMEVRVEAISVVLRERRAAEGLALGDVDEELLELVSRGREAVRQPIQLARFAGRLGVAHRVSIGAPRD